MSTDTMEKPAASHPNKPDYEIWDCDHHYYEPPEAFLRHLPKKFESDFMYVTLPNGRTKLALEGKISYMYPNPLFSVISEPGSHEEYHRGHNPEGKSQKELAGEPMRIIPAMRNGAAHLKMMDELGLHAAIIFPTLAAVIEERMGHRPDLVGALYHSLNMWVAEEYGFGNGRQFPVGAVTLGDADAAVKELEFLIKAGCNAVQVRPAPVPGPLGGRSPGAAEFDRFWATAAEAKVLITNHVGDSGYDKIYRWWKGGDSAEFVAFQKDPAQDCLDMMGRAASDFVCMMVCHGVFDRHPGLQISAVEAGSRWVGPMIERLALTYNRMPNEFRQHPVDAVRKHLTVMPFYEESAYDLAEHIGVDNVLFGSDWPHAEAIRVPLDYYNDIKDFSAADQKKIMHDNTKRLMTGAW
ncbi:amidohydrolase family protein [Novosphingobium bradum]|uniref:Amidohydrolase family protein n=1 Tax=Novosphingobium bradum TaxID=1737444 RepID=A0ABV7IKK2_9SPHN